VKQAKIDIIGGSVLCFVGAVLIIGFIFLASAIRIVPEYKRLRVYRLGRDMGKKGPGIVFLIPVIDKAMIIDLNSPVTPDNTFSLVGAIGETQTAVNATGTVLIGTQEWDAMSDYPIAPKSKVRVKRVVLEVDEDTSN
jgi:membrane-bound ClpP family serine protease